MEEVTDGRSIKKAQCIVLIMWYYIVVYEHLERSTLILCMLYEDWCCILYAFNMNVNALVCNGYFSTV